MSTLQVDRITPYQSASIQIDGDVVQANAATTGSNTFTGTQNFTQAVTASAIEITQNSGDGINLYQNGVSQIRFWSGSNQSATGTWVNMQSNPVDGALSIAAFPHNYHFVHFQPATSQSLFEGAVRIDGGVGIYSNPITIEGGAVFNSPAQLNSEFTGSINLQGNATITGIINGNDILLDDPGANSTLLFNSNFFSEFKGANIQWREGDGQMNITLAETAPEILLNGFGTGYDNAIYINATTNGAEFFDWDTGSGYVKSRWMQVPPLGAPQMDRGLNVNNYLSVNGTGTQTFNDISNGSQVDNIKVNSWTSPSGHTIANSTLGWQRYDGTVHGWVQELYTADYAYGSNVIHEPGKWGTEIFASGSAYSGGSIKLEDKGDTTVEVTLNATKTNITNVMKLSQLDPLPAGTVGELAVSGSNLYFHNGTAWSQII